MTNLTESEAAKFNELAARVCGTEKKTDPLEPDKPFYKINGEWRHLGNVHRNATLFNPAHDRNDFAEVLGVLSEREDLKAWKKINNAIINTFNDAYEKRYGVGAEELWSTPTLTLFLHHPELCRALTPVLEEICE